MMSTGTATGRRGAAAKNCESGYALLLIFAMAAAIAVMLYVELPRVAFEKQRNKEQVLIEHGEQYKRAIQLYFRKFKNYPPSIEALENTNNVRFLRRRYPDPLTGKDEWRLIHVGPGGVFTDSLTQKPKKDDKPPANTNTFITEGPAIGSALPENPRSGAAGPPRRPSEGGQPQLGTDPSVSGVVPGQTPGDPTQQGLVPGQPGVSPGPGPIPGAPPGTYIPPDGGVQPGAPPNGYQPPYPGGTPPGQTLGNTYVPPGQPGGLGQPVDPSQANNPGAYNPGANPNQPGVSPADLIGNLLRQPRPTPGATAGALGTGLAGGGLAGTGGIAGVASKVERSSIKIYNEREKYNEWEFIYDFSKDRTGAGRAGGMMGTGDPRLAQQGAQGIGGSGVGQPGGFGMQPGSGGPTGFGAQPGFGAQAGAAGGFGSNSGASGSSANSGGGGIGSGFGGSVGAGFGSPQTPGTAGQPQQPVPNQPVPNQPQQPVPQPGPIPPPPPPPPQGQTANPPQ